MEERWKLISRIVEGVHGYAISDHGRVMRLTVSQRCKITYPGLILKPAYKNSRYVRYYFHQIEELRYAHLLVLEAFVGPKPKG